MTGVVSSIFAVFTAILTWFAEAFTTVSNIFYVPASEGVTGGLTFIGTLSVIGFGIAVVLLVLAWIRSLIKNRG